MRRFDYMGSVHPLGAALPTRLGDGWLFIGASIKQAEDGQAAYILARWRRLVRLG